MKASVILVSMVALQLIYAIGNTPLEGWKAGITLAVLALALWLRKYDA